MEHIQNEKDLARSQKVKPAIQYILELLGAQVTSGTGSGFILDGQESAQFEVINSALYSQRRGGQYRDFQVPARRKQTAYYITSRAGTTHEFYIFSQRDQVADDHYYASGTKWDTKSSGQGTYSQFKKYNIELMTFFRAHEDGFQIIPVRYTKTIHSKNTEDFLAWWGRDPTVKLYDGDDVVFDPNDTTEDWFND